MFIGPVVGAALCTAFSWRAGVTPLRRVSSCSPERWRRLCSRQIAASLATAVMVFLIGCFPLSGELWASTPRSGSRCSLRSAAFSWFLRRSLAAAGARTRKASPCLGKPPRIFPQIKEHFDAIRPNLLMMRRFIRAGLRLAYTTTRQIVRSRGLLVSLRSTLLLFLS